MKKQMNWRKQQFVPKSARDEQMYQLNSIEELPKSELYSVICNGREVPVYHTEFFDYVLLVIHKSEPLYFHIGIHEEAEKIQIRPLNIKKDFTRTEDGIELCMDKPEKLVVEIDDDLLRPLYLLCAYYIEKPEGVTYYFQKGKIYNVNCLTLHSNDTVYIEEGSVVCGRFYSRMADNIRIVGNGILYGGVWHNWDENSGEQMILPVLGNHIYIEGISIADGGSWGIVPVACKDVTVRNVNVMSKVITGDGIDIVGSEDVLVEGCFIRANDDCISIKGFGNFDPSGSSDVKRVLVKDSIFWNAEFGNALEIGYETHCA